MQLDAAKAQVGGKAGEAAGDIGAEAYVIGDRAGFETDPDLPTATHEAAHIMQQRGGVQLEGGVGDVGDRYERKADMVADLTVARESAAPILAKYAGERRSHGDGVQRIALQRDKKKGDKKPKETKPPAPMLIAGTEALGHIDKGQHSLEGMKIAGTKVAALYEVMVLQAASKKIHEQVEEAYDKAKKARAKSLEKSDLEKVFTTIMLIVDLGTSVYGVVKAANTIYKSAQGLKGAYDEIKDTKKMIGEVYDVGTAGDIIKGAKQGAKKLAVEGGKAVGEGGKAGKDVYSKAKELVGSTPPFDPETILSDTNATAIKEGNTALDNLTEGEIKYASLDVYGDYRLAALDFGQMVKWISLLTRENKVMPDESLAEVRTLIDECDKLQKELQLGLTKLQATWKAYEAGGSAALAEKRERGLFEKIQGWIATGDKKAGSLRIAMDQSTKHVWFNGEMGIDSASFGRVQYLCHDYSTSSGQMEEGTLYVNDPAVSKELKDAGLVAGDVTTGIDMFMGGAGSAETAEDKRGGDKHTISIAMCKALVSAGVQGTITQATVNLYYKGKWVSQIQSPHKGPWFEKWKDTPEFEAFWRGTLGTKYAFLRPGRGEDHETIPGATKDESEKSIHVVTESAGG